MPSQDVPVRKVVGSLHNLGNGGGKVRMECSFDTDADNVWSALTEPERLARWVADIDGDLRVGGSFSATFTSGWDGSGVIDQCDHARSLVVTLSAGSDDETLVEARLADEGDRTRLVVEERGIPLGEIAAHGAGWHVHMMDLGCHLDGIGVGDWHATWVELTPAYEAMATELD